MPELEDELGRLARHAISILCAALAAVTALTWSARAQNSQERAQTDRYVALVIGNGRFVGAPALPQAEADATAVARRLSARGFQLVGSASGGVCTEDHPQIDLDLEAMRAAIACFAKAAERAKQALFYFSGLSLMLERRNYLVASGTSLQSPPAADVLVDLNSVLHALDQAKPGLSVAVLDAARSAVNDFVGGTRGLARVAATERPRIVAYSAPIGAWSEDSGLAEKRGRRARLGELNNREHPDTYPNSLADASLSPYTRRLVRLLDDDLDLRSLEQPGFTVATLFLGAADAGRSDGTGAPEVTIENVVSADMLGRLPDIGKGACEFIAWRAETLGNCTEMAASYETCGRAFSMREKLQRSCPAEWSTLVRYALQASMTGVMKAKTCSAFKEFIAKFESEPSTAELKEFQEIRSLAQYTCALEAKEQLRARLAPVLSARDCAKTHALLVDGKGIIDAEARGKLEKLANEVCCPDYRLGAVCVTRSGFISRVVAKLQQTGCVAGSTAEVRVAHARNLVKHINAKDHQEVNLTLKGAPLDRVWTRIQALKRDDCLCWSRSVDACPSDAKPAVAANQLPSPAPSLAVTSRAATTSPEGRDTVSGSSLIGFIIRDNLDIFGQDIPQGNGAIGAASADTATCAADCQANQSCVAFSFDRWNGRCYLKNKVVTALLDARSTIAVKKPLQLPSSSTGRIEVQVLRNRRFSASSVARRQVSDFAACRGACAGDSRCVAFTFFKSGGKGDNCDLFDLTNGYIRDESTDSGFKYQPP